MFSSCCRGSQEGKFATIITTGPGQCQVSITTIMKKNNLITFIFWGTFSCLLPLTADLVCSTLFMRIKASSLLCHLALVEWRIPETRSTFLAFFFLNDCSGLWSSVRMKTKTDFFTIFYFHLWFGKYTFALFERLLLIFKNLLYVHI